MGEHLQNYAINLLQGKRVRLRPLREEDLQSLGSWWNDPAWMVFQGTKIVPTPSSPTAEMFRVWSSNKDASSFGFSVEDIDSERLVGHVTIWGVDPVVRSGTLGIMIGGQYVAQGFGTDAIRILLRFAFEELGLNKIELSLWEYNSRALRTYENFGFVIEGTRRAAAYHAGRYWAQIQMGILKSEFLATR